MCNIRVTLLVMLVFICTASQVKAAETNWLFGHLKRIFGGRRERISEYPYLVNIKRYNRFKCGGSLITPTCVLTAAHCLENNYRPHGLQVTVMNECLGDHIEDMQEVEQIIKPIQFDFDNSLDMDIAILKLHSTFDSTKVHPIELQTEPLAPYTELNVAGWGDTGKFEKFKCLRSTNVTVTPQQRCRIINKRLHPITENMFCAKGINRRDACKGDSGGPIVHAGKQVGIVSWGKGCSSRFQGVYTRLSSVNVLAFLNQTISKYC